MNCREVLARLYDYLDAELTPAERQDLQKHLEHCSDCLHKYQLEEQFDRVVHAKLNTPCEVNQLKTRILAEIAKIDRQQGAAPAGNNRNLLFLLMPIAAAILITVFLINPFAPKRSVLEAVYPYAMEHNKCLDHVMQYIVQSHDPAEVKAALAHIGAVPEDLLQPPTGQFQLAGAAIAHVDNHDNAHLEYTYAGEEVSVFVLDKNTIDKSHFDRQDRDGKSFYLGSCPKFQYVIWSCEQHECVAVSLMPEDKLLQFASSF